MREVSIGDYVLSGGEIAAMVLIDACVRLLPGVIGAEGSLAEESFESGLLEYPQYTKPREWEGHAIPEVLLSGDHKKIAEWRRREAERITAERRPDLLKPKTLAPRPIEQQGDHQRDADDDELIDRRHQHDQPRQAFLAAAAAEERIPVEPRPHGEGHGEAAEHRRARRARPAQSCCRPSSRPGAAPPPKGPE